MAFQQGWRDCVIEDNPAAKVPLLKASESETPRRAFTVKELQALLDVADADWRGMILFGVYTGQRLGDIIRLRWSDIDFETDTLSLNTRKTNRRQILPIAHPLHQWLAENRGDTPPPGPIFPAFLSKLDTKNGVGPISNAFYDLMVSAGLVESRSHG